MAVTPIGRSINEIMTLGPKLTPDWNLKDRAFYKLIGSKANEIENTYLILSSTR